MKHAVEASVIDVKVWRLQVKLSTAAKACDMSTKQFRLECESSPLLNPYTLGTAADESGRNIKTNYIDWNELVAWIEHQKVINSIFQTPNSKA